VVTFWRSELSVRMAVSRPQVYQFGQFELDVDAAELRRDGRPVRLQPQPCTLLALLVRRAGAVVSRQEIRAELWRDDTFVDFDQAVNFAVKQIRDAIGDPADRPVYIQTVPKRGYRFIAPVTAPPDPSAVMSLPSGTNTVRLQKALWTNIAEMRLAQERQRKMTMTAIAVAAALLVALVIYVFRAG
jgi:DNA-binding winged helix-turn-helix (wHTH) protein